MVRRGVNTAGRTALRRLIRSVPPLDRAVRRVRRTDEIVALHRELQRLGAGAGVTGPTDYSAVAPFLTWAPAGHFYSPVPDLTQVRSDAARIFARPPALPGVDLNEAGQLDLFRSLAPLARQARFNRQQGPDARYWVTNPSYCVGDALILYAMLRHLSPRRYLEVGSGWSTALAVDVNEQHLAGRMQITCVEPFPAALRALLRPNDKVEVLAEPVQRMDASVVERLQAGDLLFVDCSHVVKVGSDAHHLITRLLPLVAPGVYVHVHDVFYPFEYPQSWVEEGRAWTEAYLLHAFLLFNQDFQVVAFNDWLALRHRDLVAEQLPDMLEAPGGAIWLRRR